MNYILKSISENNLHFKFATFKTQVPVLTVERGIIGQQQQRHERTRYFF